MRWRRKTDKQLMITK